VLRRWVPPVARQQAAAAQLGVARSGHADVVARQSAIDNSTSPAPEGWDARARAPAPAQTLTPTGGGPRSSNNAEPSSERSRAGTGAIGSSTAPARLAKNQGRVLWQSD